MDDKMQRLFNRGCVEYGLLEDGDRILVALSGGKDSLAMTGLMASRARIFRPRIEVEAAHVVMDNIPYETDIDYLRQFCDDCGIALNVLHARFDDTVATRKPKCFLCSWHRRKALFEYAVSRGFNKVALGHHQDDIIATMLMNLTFEGSFSTMRPLLHLEHYPLAIIRPMCLVGESLIAEHAQAAGYKKQNKACPYEQATQRTTIRDLLAQMERINPEARQSVWRAITKTWTE